LMISSTCSRASTFLSRMKRQKINVAVTGLNAIDSPGPGVPVIRALRESKTFDMRIIGLSYDALEPGIYMSELVDKTYQLPFPSAGRAVLEERLRYINSVEDIDVIIPTLDAELFNFVYLSGKLKEELGINTFLPDARQLEDRDKVNLPAFGKKHQVKVPFSQPIFSTSEIPALLEEFTYPFMVKGKLYEAYAAYSPEHAAGYFNKISARWGLPVIIQEIVHGSELNVCALGDGRGNTVGAIPMRKLYVTDKGKGWSGVSLADPLLVSMAERIIRSTHWPGGLELEIIKTADNEYYLIEVNPRFPAWVYFTVACGQNQPEALLKLALGRRVKPFAGYKVGKIFVRYSFDLIVDLKQFEQISTAGEL
jgi:carbamoyl-phosphate synthase large subunit